MLRPVPIRPDAIYDDGCVVISLDIPSSTLARARRTGRLRYSRRGRRTYYLGRWLIDWLISDSTGQLLDARPPMPAQARGTARRKGVPL